MQCLATTDLAYKFSAYMIQTWGRYLADCFMDRLQTIVGV